MKPEAADASRRGAARFFDSAESDLRCARLARAISGGGASGSRWGLCGSEDPGDGWKADFVFEQGFDLSDNGVPQGNGTICEPFDGGYVATAGNIAVRNVARYDNGACDESTRPYGVRLTAGPSGRRGHDRHGPRHAEPGRQRVRFRRELRHR